MKIHKNLVIQIFQALRDIFEKGFHADKVVERHLKINKKWGARDRRFFAENVYGVVRWWRKLWVLLNAEPSFQDSQLWRLWGLHYFVTYNEIPSFDEVSFLKKINIESELKRIEKSSAVYHSIPDWLYELGRVEIGEKWDDILLNLNQQAKVVLRANTLKITAEKLRDKLIEDGITTKLLSGDAIELIERKNVFQTQCFKNGLFEVQDASSQLVAPLLKPEPNMRVVDACAGAGGKTLHLAALMKNTGKIIALDVIPAKLEELKKRTRRAGVFIVETRPITSTKVIKRLYGTADRLLLDVPCSGIGVLKRNPDTKWKLTKSRVLELCQLQETILNQYHPIVKRGGVMVYSTCSILKSENSVQVQKFLERNNQWELIEEKTVLPNESGYDGFYMAQILRK